MRRRYEDEEFVRFFEGLAGLLILGILYSVYHFYQTERTTFYILLACLIGLICIVIVLIIFLSQRADRRKDSFIAEIETKGIKAEIMNFIHRFGTEKRSKRVWGFRDHYFTWHRLEDFRDMLREKRIPVSSKKWDDTLFIVRHYINIEEKKVTNESIGTATKKFSALSGQDFENLLYRLFTSAGYTVQRTGKTGDQGADLITNKGNERAVIQAKRYQSSVGNSAVQEAVAAQKLYDCNKACVVTTSEFTAEAKTLAKANNVELIEKVGLQRLLLQYLKESWS